MYYFLWFWGLTGWFLLGSWKVGWGPDSARTLGSWPRSPRGRSSGLPWDVVAPGQGSRRAKATAARPLGVQALRATRTPPAHSTGQSLGFVSFFFLFSWSAVDLGGFPGGISGKQPTCQCRDVRDAGSIPGWGNRSPGEGNGNPLQYSCLENPTDGRSWWATAPQGCKELDTSEVT